MSTSKEKAIEAHARDELGIDLEDLDEKTNPWQVRERAEFCVPSCMLLRVYLVHQGA